MKTFKSILDFQKHFDTDEKCREHLEQERWNGTPACPFCGSLNVCRFANKRDFKCREKECRNRFTATSGTIYHSSKLPLTKWFLATYILSYHSKGISSLQLSKWLGTTQKTAWHLSHRIRQMLTENDPTLLEGIIEIDEVYLGGLEGNKHASKRTVKGGVGNKTMVLAAVQRKGKVKAKVIPETTIEHINEAIEGFVATGDSTMVITDEHRAYGQVKEKYNHKTVNHQAKEYVRNENGLLIHTNSVEGYWNILRKQLEGIHHSVSPKHLQRYCEENAWRYNYRQLPQDARFSLALKNCIGTLKYKTLIANNDK